MGLGVGAELNMVLNTLQGVEIILGKKCMTRIGTSIGVCVCGRFGVQTLRFQFFCHSRVVRGTQSYSPLFSYSFVVDG